MKTLTKITAGITMFTSLGFANKGAAEDIIMMQRKEVLVPYQVLVPQTRLVPETRLVPQTIMIPQTNYQRVMVDEPVVYRRVEPVRKNCCLGEFVEGALSFPFELLRDLTDCRPRCQPQPRQQLRQYYRPQQFGHQQPVQQQYFGPVQQQYHGQVQQQFVPRQQMPETNAPVESMPQSDHRQHPTPADPRAKHF